MEMEGVFAEGVDGYFVPESPISDNQQVNIGSDTEAVRLSGCIKNLSRETEGEIVLDSEDEGMHGNEGIHVEAMTRGRCVGKRRYAPGNHSCEGYLRKKKNPLWAMKERLDVEKTRQDLQCSEMPRNLGRISRNSCKEASARDDDDLNHCHSHLPMCKYVESQEPERSSEENALKVVDLYLLNNDPNAYPLLETGAKGRSLSPQISHPNGPQTLARIKNQTLLDKKLEVFDWSGNSSGDEETSSLNRRKINLDLECNIDGLCDGVLAVQKPKAVGNVFQLNSGEGRSSSNKMEISKFQALGTSFQDELHKDEQDQLDVVSTYDYEVGFDTQVAAEAMEALSYALPLNLDPFCKHKGTKKETQLSSNPPKGAREDKRIIDPELLPPAESGLPFSRELRSKKRTSRRPLRKLDADFSSFNDKKCGLRDKRRGKMGNHQNNNQSSSSFLERFTDQSFKKSLEVMNKKDNLVYWVHPRGKRTHKGVSRHSSGWNNQYASSTVVSNCNSSTITDKGIPKCRDGDISANLKHVDSYDLFSIVSSDVVLTDRTINTVSSGNHIEQYDFKGSKHGRRLSRTFLTKELAKLGHRESLPDFMPRNSRRRKGHTNVKVLLSQGLDKRTIKRQKKIVARLGFSMASCCSDASHFVADKFLRTKNMLEAMAIGIPVVTHLWLESCGQANSFINEKMFILRDYKKEREIGFSMPDSLAFSRQHPLLRDHKVFITPNVKPSRCMIQSLVTAVQGQEVAETKDVTTQGGTLVLSSEEDFAACAPFLKKGIAVYSSELLLNGIVTQKLEYERYRLFNNHVKEDCPISHAL
ncbi:unnamed protein product [Cuscuta campestris]|uniref:BRCT domain-containing protein n=1 Tax=Cuscuta campestris TaxID=132261 RepID=A0A484LBX9_9ASTE|nr:unnamed protein product [Cuscuta campestris]